MPRPSHPLATRYGKLRVLSERRELGRRMVMVRCDCGAEKELFADQLFSGRARSCGAATCRANVGVVKPVPSYRPRGPRTITTERLKKYWDIHTKDMVSGAAIADEYAENKNTLYSAFRAIRLAGGWAKYIAKCRL